MIVVLRTPFFVGALFGASIVSNFLLGQPIDLNRIAGDAITWGLPFSLMMILASTPKKITFDAHAIHLCGWLNRDHEIKWNCLDATKTYYKPRFLQLVLNDGKSNVPLWGKAYSPAKWKSFTQWLRQHHPEIEWR